MLRVFLAPRQFPPLAQQQQQQKKKKREKGGQSLTRSISLTGTLDYKFEKLFEHNSKRNEEKKEEEEELNKMIIKD